MKALHGDKMIAPVFILSTGRCGSTMLSNTLNLHPQVLSLSEFFSFVGMGIFRRKKRTGDKIWEFYSRQQTRTKNMLKGRYEELLYPIDHPGARFQQENLPPILCATLPHISPDAHEELFDEMEPVVRNSTSLPPAVHIRRHFEWLARRFEKRCWVERSGSSLVFAPLLLARFPDARVVHIYRDGRETACSMSRHYLFQMITATIKSLGSWGFDVPASIRKNPRWGQRIVWAEPFISALLRPGKLNFDKVTLSDVGTYWSALIEGGMATLGGLPRERLLNLKFEDIQRSPREHLRSLIEFVSPELVDESWLAKAATLVRQTPSRFAKLDSAKQQALSEACAPGLKLLGYSL